MIEKRPMTTEDFLVIMEQNAHIYPEYAALPQDKKVQWAKLNTDTGTAVSYLVDGKLVAVGGLRCIGLAEAWMVTAPEVRDESKKSLFRETKNELISAQEQGIWRVFAETRISENFLEHLGFKKQEMYIMTRTPQ
jgi:hypothetical protein